MLGDKVRAMHVPQEDSTRGIDAIDPPALDSLLRTSLNLAPRAARFDHFSYAFSKPGGPLVKLLQELLR